jgi:OFA family oxalate/formate antiporter-like MFS transporter
MKYVILAASVVIQVCLGGIYAWSSLVPALKSGVGLSTTQTQIVFGCLFGTFTLSMVAAGKLLDRVGPRIVAAAGGVLFGAGYLLASHPSGSFPLMLVGISLLAGAGTGAGYVCPLTTCMKWFPRRRGLVTGVSMAGFGGGAVLLSTLAEYLLGGGMHVLEIFRWIGLTYGVALVGAAMALRFPVADRAAHKEIAPPVRLLVRDPFFLALVLGMFSGTFAGMLVIGNLKPMALASGITPVAATAAISVFALGNAAGRLTWGWLCDRTDERMIPLKLAALAAPLALLALATAPALFIGLSFAVGFGFGACFVVYAAQVASRYGSPKVAGIYPLVFLAYGLAGIVAPPLGGWLYDRTQSYTPALVLSCCVVGFGIVGSFLLLRMARGSGRQVDVGDTAHSP